MNLLAQAPLRANPEAVAGQKHPYHQLGVDRGAAHGAQKRGQMADFAPVSPDIQAVAIWAAMNSRGERILRPECGWFSF
jgi:hypothetical protein